MSKRLLDKWLFALIILLAPMSITMWNKIFLVVIFCLSGLLLISTFFSPSKVALAKSQAIVVTLYFVMFAVGFISLMVSIVQPFGMVVDSDTFGRIFTICVLFLMFLSGLSYMNSLNDKEFLKLRSLFLIPGLVFTFFGIYQLICNYTGMKFFIETRDWMHGVPLQVVHVFPKRLTSIAEEPSFLAPILVEFLILSAFLVVRPKRQYFLVGLSMCMLLMTFSGGAYVNTLSILIVATCLMLWKKPFGKLHISVIVGVIVTIILVLSFGQPLIEFAINKFTHEATGGSSRSQFMSNLTGLIFDANTFNMLFGHGLTSLSYLSDFGMHVEDVLFRISNNMFIDVAWESGLVGGLFVLSVYGILFAKGIKIQFKKNTSLSLSLMLVTQALITAFYRSEYISTHFIWVLIVIFWALRYEELNLNLKENISITKSGCK